MISGQITYADAGKPKTVGSDFRIIRRENFMVAAGIIVDQVTDRNGIGFIVYIINALMVNGTSQKERMLLIGNIKQMVVLNINVIIILGLHHTVNAYQRILAGMFVSIMNA